ncbi:MAG: TRAP transporter small permease, partial [Deltaproteobacteria bacterium]|nr:TRAP transporter small permease [Deltaproteobacteria bacterium]
PAPDPDAGPDAVPGAGDGVPRGDADIPKTRQHEAGPKLRPSQTALEGVTSLPISYPDDGPTSSGLRKIDSMLGLAEQGVLFAILIAIVVTASTHAILEKAVHEGLWFAEDIIRGGTFSIAMIGAAFATQQQRHLAMDLLSRKFSPRGRLVLAVVLELFTIFICLIVVRSGLHQLDATSNWTGRHLFHVSTIVQFLPLGAGLIIVHAFLHLAIDIDYLVRGKLPPERARSAH